MLSPAMKSLGFGLGLRPDHYDAILSGRPKVGFFEALTENYLVPGGKALHYLEGIRAPSLGKAVLSLNIYRVRQCTAALKVSDARPRYMGFVFEQSIYRQSSGASDGKP